MSAQGRGAERRPDDFYATPEWAVLRFLEVVDLPAGQWLEPAAGNGAIIKAARAFKNIHWDAMELRETPENVEGLRCVDGEVSFGDFLEAVLLTAQSPDPVEPYDVVISNPPFSLAMEFIQASFLVGRYVAMLLRTNFLESELRAEFMRECPPDVYVLPNRPDFTGGGGDATSYAWFVWPPKRNRTEGKVRVLATTHKDIRKSSKPRLTLDPQSP